MARLEGKVALVSGGASGIGEAIARAFVSEGAHVLLSDIDNERGRRVASELGDHADYRELDVRVEADWQAAVDALLARFGRLDILVNNAGITGLEDEAAPQAPLLRIDAARLARLPAPRKPGAGHRRPVRCCAGAPVRRGGRLAPRSTGGDRIGWAPSAGALLPSPERC